MATNVSSQSSSPQIESKSSMTPAAAAALQKSFEAIGPLPSGIAELVREKIGRVSTSTNPSKLPIRRRENVPEVDPEVRAARVAEIARKSPKLYQLVYAETYNPTAILAELLRLEYEAREALKPLEIL